jgi:hypothetical protein
LAWLEIVIENPFSNVLIHVLFLHSVAVLPD